MYVALQLLRRVTSSSIPQVAGWNLPITVTMPIPISILNILAHSLDESLHRAHAVLLLWATLDTSQRRNTVIYNDAYL